MVTLLYNAASVRSRGPLTLFAVRIGMAIPILYFGTQLLAAPYFKAETAKGRIPGLSAAVLQNGPPSKALGDGHHGANGALARWLSESVSYGINRLELVTQTVAIWNHIREWLRRLLNPLTTREEPRSARRWRRVWQEYRSQHRSRGT